MLEAMKEVFPGVKYQRCTVRFYCTVFSVTHRSKVKLVARRIKFIHVQERKSSGKIRTVVEELRPMKLEENAKKAEGSIEENPAYCEFLSEHLYEVSGGPRKGISAVS